MKNLTKIFMAVAVAMFAFSCVNDATEDIAVKVGGKTTLAISLENTRTQLGEAENGVYPITWAEGDQITVNGETSEPLAAADADTANAVFTFNAELAAPYCVAYPAAEANQVVFAAEQEYVDGTFANGAATMYGYARNGNITLNHLTGVLKIGVVCGEDVDFFDAPIIQSVKISTIDRAPIAGAFNINFETGAVTATDDAVSVINYSIDEKLSQSPTYLHVAVPAGVYNELYVTLEDNKGGVMYATVKANDDKPLVAGNVRTFSSDIVYAATNAVVIKDAASLKAWAAGAKESTADAIMAADVDMSNETWTPVDGFKGRFLGNGFAIKGLSQPLFGTTNAKVIKGVHLVDANMTITNLPDAGTLACDIVETDAVVSHCSATGTLVINTNKPTVKNGNNYYGALIGVTKSAKTFSNLYTNVALSTASTSVNSSGKHLYLTNLLGKGDSANEGTCVALENVTAHGTISHNSNSQNQLYVGGLACTGVKSMTNCANGDPNDETHTKGSITLGANQTKNVFCCAMLNFIAPYVTLTNCHNYGNVVVNMTSINNSFMLGGLAHAARGGLFDGCSNHGNFIFTSIETNSSSNFWVGGITAGDTGAADSSTNRLNNCQNYGKIVFENGTTLRYTAVGGLIGRRDTKAATEIKNCTNYGNIELGDINDDANRVKNAYAAHFGGLIGMVSGTTEVKMENCVNNGALLLNINSNMPNSDSGCMRVGGIVGTLGGRLTDINTTVTNNGEIVCSFVNVKTTEITDPESNEVIGTEYVKPGNISVGGVFGRVAENVMHDSNSLKLHNNGNVTVSMNPDHFATTGGVGGIVGILTPAASSLSNASCDCTVTAIGLPAAMLCGDLYSATTKATNCQIAGKINTTGTEVTIDQNNFFEYLYGRSSEYNTATQAETDNITLYKK